MYFGFKTGHRVESFGHPVIPTHVPRELAHKEGHDLKGRQECRHSVKNGRSVEEIIFVRLWKK